MHQADSRAERGNFGQNEELVAQSEELMTHRDQLETQNKIIESQNLQLTHYTENLEGIVAERTQEVAAQSQQITEFAFITAHNLRGPLARMKGLSNLFTHGLMDRSEQEMVVNSLNISLDEMDSVVHNMQEALDLQQLSISDWQAISIGSHLQKRVEKLPSSFLNSFQLDIPPHLTIQTSVDHFNAVIDELLANAIKFSNPTGSLAVKISAQKTEGKIWVTIADNGLGMDLNSYKDKVFKMYQRFHLHIPGKGLGLFLTRLRMKKLRGEIEIESENGIGTLFRLTFELAAK